MFAAPDRGFGDATGEPMKRRDIIRPARLATAAMTVLALLVVGSIGAAAAGAGGGPGARDTASQTVTGTVATLSPSPVLAESESSDGTISYCEVWDVVLRTSGGLAVTYDIESPMSGTFPKLTAIDKSAAQRVHTLIVAYSHQKTVAATLTYTPGPGQYCGHTLENVVTAVSLSVSVPAKKGQLTGVMVGLHPRSTVSANGAQCAIWIGEMLVHRSQDVFFDVESTVTGGRASPQALKLVTTLTRAQRQRRSTRLHLSYTGPVMACNTLLDYAVTAASIVR